MMREDRSFVTWMGQLIVGWATFEFAAEPALRIVCAPATIDPRPSRRQTFEVWTARTAPCPLVKLDPLPLHRPLAESQSVKRPPFPWPLNVGVNGCWFTSSCSQCGQYCSPRSCFEGKRLCLVTQELTAHFRSFPGNDGMNSIS